MFKNQPKGLFALALANTGERFGYYTMLAVFALFLRANFGAIPMGGVEYGSTAVAMTGMIGALVLISFGTGLFKGNLQVMVGNLYDDPQYADRRDAAFSLFYMAINIGAMFAPTAAVKIMDWAQSSLGVSVNDSYHFAFAVACASLILSIAIYYACRPWFKHVENTVKQAAASGQKVETLTPEQTKKRIVALCLVFAVVLFFWMADQETYCGALSCVCGCAVLLDGIPPERSDADLFRQ